jgi:putative integral membrane protein (TIGR02587 family)
MSAARNRPAKGSDDLDPILRACAGALLGALPLLYTMEMWWYARVISEPVLLAMMAIAGVVAVLSILFGGFRRGRVTHLGIDTLVVFGIGIAIAAITLLIVGRIQPGQVPLTAAARMIALEAVPCAIGAALAMTQFRPRDGSTQNVDRRIDRLSQDRQKVLATLVGAVFFAFNVAPTDEPWLMAMEAERVHFPLIVLFSLLVSYVIVFEADFAERPRGYTTGTLGNPHAETIVSYMLSLGVSYAFLVGFGHVSPETPIYAQIRGTVMLGYVTTIGGSAGRILVAG